jgi:hypothetical protein
MGCDGKHRLARRLLSRFGKRNFRVDPQQPSTSPAHVYVAAGFQFDLACVMRPAYDLQIVEAVEAAGPGLKQP